MLVKSSALMLRNREPITVREENLLVVIRQNRAIATIREWPEGHYNPALT